MVRLLQRDWQPSDRRRIAASLLLAAPVAILLAFAVGEMAGGEPSGAQHILQAAPLAALLAGGWRYPRVVGWLLLGTSAILLLAWLVWVMSESEPDISLRWPDIALWIGTGAVLFGLPALAGWLFVSAARSLDRA